MNTKLCLRWLLACITLGAILVAPARACGLHPTIGGGIQSSYPGALDIAVAVAEARQKGVLPQAKIDSLSPADRYPLMLADLRRLQSQLKTAHHNSADSSAAEFSLVLIGPSLWSHYQLTPTGVQARFHVHGPVNGKAVVLTHHVVLRALLDGDLTAGQAAELGLIAFSGNNTDPVRKTFETGFQSRT